MAMKQLDEFRTECNRFERIILDTLRAWQWNRNYVLKQRGPEPFDIDELLEVISGYGPWSSPKRELPMLAVYFTLRYFTSRKLIRKIDNDTWKICFKEWGNEE